MFGILRFFLAGLVLFSHVAPALVGPFHYGPVAVVGFYILSGYLMAYIFIKKYHGWLAHAGRFYGDRFLRIYPLYFVMLVLTVLVYYDVLDVEPIISWSAVWSNILAFPLTFYEHVNVGILARDPLRLLSPESTPIIPQATSLGLEIQFYFLVPFIVWIKQWGRVVLLYVSLALFILSGFGVWSQLPTSIVYYYLPWMLFTFLGGFLLYDITAARGRQKQRLLLVLKSLFVVCGLALMGIVLGKQPLSFTHDVLLGFVLFLPTVFYLSKLSRDSRLDALLASLSYGIFLGHTMVIAWCEHYLPVLTMYAWAKTGVVLVITLLVSFCGHVLIERPVAWYRKQRFG